ncbi:hypothetical protein [Streptomyces sp. NPDC058157]|uniref:hypothetical protein n=1 Tax=Streptomyces sp. NPDC058157 TaxID=3346360 RepID=UPI0036E73963
MAGESSIGGPLAWPADEAWPECLVPDDQDGSGRNPCAMVPVLQLYRRDVPGAWWPEGVDLFQLLWCPNEHWGSDAPGQAEGAPVVLPVWRRVAETEGCRQRAGVPPVRFEEWLVPRACAVGVEEAVEGRPVSRYDVWKLGGRAWWSTTDPCAYACSACEVSGELLLTVSSGDVSGLDVGGGGELRVYRCPVDLGHGYHVDLQ